MRGGNDTRPRDLKQRLMEKVSPEPNSGCWLWDGAYVTGGYGYIARGRGTGRGPAHAHKVSFELFKGPVGDKFVLHACDNTCCVNPDHLFLGTHKENMMDMVLKGRAAWQTREVFHNTKLKQSDVDDIRSRRMRNADYARLYNVSPSMITKIIKGQRRSLNRCTNQAIMILDRA